MGIIAAVVLTLAVHSPPQAQALLVQPLKGAVAALAKSSGVQLEVHGSIQDRLLFLKPGRLSIAEQKEAIARALYARWIREPDKEFLVPDQAEVSRAETSYKKWWAEHLRVYLDEGQESKLPLSAHKAAEDLLTQIRSLIQRLPPEGDLNAIARNEGYFAAGQLCKKLLVALGTNSLSELRSGEHLVFSTHPLDSEWPLPKECSRVLENAREVQMTFLGLLESQSPPSGAEELWKSLQHSAKALIGSPQIILSILRSGTQLGARCDVYVDDRRVDTSFEQFTPTETVPIRPHVPSVEMTESSKQVYRHLLEAADSEYMPAATSSKFLLRSEPLDYIVPESLTALSSESIVACIPDPLFEAAFRSATKDQVDLGRFLNRSASAGVEFEKRGDVLVIRPRAPSMLAGQGRFRRAVESLLKGSSSPRDIPNFEALAFYSDCQHTVGALTPLGRLYPDSMAMNGWAILRPRFVYHEALKFFGTLTIPDLSHLQRGGALEVSRLNPLQISALKTWLSTDMTSSAIFSDAGARRFRRAKRVLLRVASDIRLHARPRRGLSGSATGQAKSVEEWKQFLNGIPKEYTIPREQFLASHEWWIVKPTQWNFTIEFGEKGNLWAQFLESLPSKQDFQSWESLPPDLRAKLASK